MCTQWYISISIVSLVDSSAYAYYTPYRLRLQLLIHLMRLCWENEGIYNAIYRAIGGEYGGDPNPKSIVDYVR